MNQFFRARRRELCMLCNILLNEMLDREGARDGRIQIWRRVVWIETPRRPEASFRIAGRCMLFPLQ